MTLFCKDRLDDTDDPNGVAVYWHIRSSRKMFIEITKDNDGTSTQSVGVGRVIDNAWNFIAVSLDCSNHKDTVVEFYRDNVLKGTKTISDKFIDDKAAWKAFIGAQRATNTPTWQNNRNLSGFLYDFHLYQRPFDTADKN